MNVFRALGVRIDGPRDGRVTVHGVGLHGLRGTTHPLDCGNAGTAMRLLMGLLAGQRFESTLVGDESLSKRPMRRVAEPLAAMGARIEIARRASAGAHPAVRERLHGIDYPMPVASAQVKSALLLAGLYARRRDHRRSSRRRRATIPSACWAGSASQSRAMAPRSRCAAARRCARRRSTCPRTSRRRPSSWSARRSPRARTLLLEHVGINPTRTGVLEILRLMGADIERCATSARRAASRSPTCGCARRRCAESRCRAELVPLAIDEFPALFVAAACAQRANRGDRRARNCGSRSRTGSR